VAEVQSTEQRIGPVDLTVPASSEHLRVLRLVTSSLASSLGLDVDQLDDLRIAVDELCSMLIEHASDETRISLTMSDDGGRLLVDGGLGSGGSALATVDPVSRLILDGLGVDWSVDASSPSFRLAAPGRKPRDGF